MANRILVDIAAHQLQGVLANLNLAQLAGLVKRQPNGLFSVTPQVHLPNSPLDLLQPVLGDLLQRGEAPAKGGGAEPANGGGEAPANGGGAQPRTDASPASAGSFAAAVACAACCRRTSRA